MDQCVKAVGDCLQQALETDINILDFIALSDSPRVGTGLQDSPSVTRVLQITISTFNGFVYKALMCGLDLKSNLEAEAFGDNFSRIQHSVRLQHG